MELPAEAVRVLGCLIEKARTVPDTYPLTLNSLVSACNQSSNRWPVTDYDAGTVQRTLDDLKVDGWVRFVHPSHGERTTKFRHVVDERLGLGDDELAVLAVLGLRGPQTVGELRTRCERLHPFASLDEVGRVLDRLAARDEPLVVALPRRSGEREGRWAHLLGGPVDDGASYESARPERASSASASVGGEAVEALTARVVELEAQVARLYELLGEAPDSIG
jgi:uncharacterized protein YceH (UPF0502 family)